MNYDKGSLIAQRTLKALLLFLENEKLTLTEISRFLETSNPATYRIISTLVDMGFLIKDGNKRYQLSSIFLKFADRVKHDLRGASLPVMEKLSEKTQESVYLSVSYHASTYIFIEGVESSHPLKWSVNIGEPMPADAGAVGKAHLAFRDDTEMEQMVEKMTIKPYTKNTIVDKVLLLEELKKIKRQGYSFSIGERYPEVIGLSAPIYNHSSRNAVAVLSIFIPRYRYNEVKFKKFIDLLKEAAKNISSKI